MLYKTLNVSIGKLQKHSIEKQKYPNKYLLEILNTKLTFAIPKWIKKEWVTYPEFLEKLIKVLLLVNQLMVFSGLYVYSYFK